MRLSVAAQACALLTVLAIAASCNKEPPPKRDDEPKKTTPVPTDMVFNDFLPPSGGGEGLAVRMDGGVALEGGTGAAAGSEGTAQNAAGATGAGGGDAMKVVEPGAEPRAKRRYAFTLNKAERRNLLIRQSVAQDKQVQEQPALSLTVDFVAKEAKPTATRFEMKVVEVDLADKDKVDPRIVQQAAQELGMFKGLSATFSVSARGEVGEVTLSGSEKMQREGAAEILDAFTQFVELVLAPLPDEPIGDGAKWEKSETVRERGVEQSSKRTLELKESSETGATVVSTIEKKVPKRKLPDPRMPPGTTMEVDGKGSYTYSLRFDRIATKVTGEQTSNVTIEVPTGGGGGDDDLAAPKAGPKKKIVQQAKVRHTMTAPEGGKK